MLGGLVNFQWVQFLSIREVSKVYFGVSDSAVTWTGNVTSLMFVIVVIPVTILFDTVKLRTTLLVAASFNAVGTLVKAASTTSFIGMIVGQCLGERESDLIVAIKSSYVECDNFLQFQWQTSRCASACRNISNG